MLCFDFSLVSEEIPSFWGIVPPCRDLSEAIDGALRRYAELNAVAQPCVPANQQRMIKYFMFFHGIFQSIGTG
jgi:hypothetical protein